MAQRRIIPSTCYAGKPRGGLSAISEQRRMPEKEAGSRQDFSRSGRLQQAGCIFRQVGYVWFAASWSSCDVHWSYAEKEDIPFFSAVHQLLLAAHGRERLSHKSSSSWALLCTRCVPRWRYRSR